MITAKVDVKGGYLLEVGVFVEKPSSEQARIFPRELYRRLLEEFDVKGVTLPLEGTKAGAVNDADDQVGAMRHFARLEVLFKGKPDPALRIFARHIIAKLKQQAAPGAKVDLKQLQNVKQLGASGNK